MLVSPIVDLFRAALFAVAHVFGGSLGAAIVVAAVALRVVMLPLSLGAAKRRLVREAKLRALAPQLAEIKRRYAGSPGAFDAATRRLHEAHGIPLFDGRSLVDSLLQFPPAAALYSAVRALPRGVRFLWVTDLVAPDRVLATVAALISAAVTWLATTTADASRAAQIAPILTAVVTYVILSHFSAGVALYSLANSVIGATEQALARRMLAREAT
jgi:YidC/Oxa1 family membrane protein insertase